MYGQMSRTAHHYGGSPMPFPPNKFLNSNFRQHQTYPFIQGVNGPFGPQQLNWNPYLNAHTPQNNYFPQPMQGFQQMPISQQHSNTVSAQSVFQNPLMPVQNPYEQNQQMNSSSGYSYMNPYPKGSFLAKPPSGMKSVLNSFKSQDGSIDINKMVDTAGQVVNAVSQVSSVVKGFGGMFKA